jgi:hypothetical protein
LSVCALNSVGHAQDIADGEAGRLTPEAAELDGDADVHAASASARPAATPVTPATRPGLPHDLMLNSIDASLSRRERRSGNHNIYLFYNI